MLSLGGNLGVEDTKVVGKKPLTLTKPTENNPTYFKGVLKMVKKLSNEVVYLKKNSREGSLHHKPLRPFHKKNNNQPKPLDSSNLNLDEFGMDHLCSYD
jgi:hypothetical protein